MAATSGFQFIRACSTGDSKIVRQLLTNGLSPETRDRYGLTGLIWAARKGRIEVAEVLLEFGADVNATDTRSRTALHHTIPYRRRDFLAFIIARGAALNHRDVHGCTALDLATYAGDKWAVTVLESHGAGRAQTPTAQPLSEANNSFCLPAIMGGGKPELLGHEHRRLRRLFGEWNGDYCSEVKTFSFLLMVDGELLRHSELDNLRGTQQARRSKETINVKIYVTQEWWKEGPPAYKRFLANAIEEGLQSMIALMQRNKHQINSELLLSDWAKVKDAFLAG